MKWGRRSNRRGGSHRTSTQHFSDIPLTLFCTLLPTLMSVSLMQAPERYFRNNVLNTLNLLDAMRARGIQTIVFSSTCATYGHPRQIPITEDHIQEPINPYGESKRMVEPSSTGMGRFMACVG